MYDRDGAPFIRFVCALLLAPFFFSAAQRWAAFALLFRRLIAGPTRSR